MLWIYLTVLNITLFNKIGPYILCFLIVHVLLYFNESRVGTKVINCYLHSTHYIFFKNSNFIKESFYIDFLQKKLLDNFFKKTFVISTQFYNLMVLNTITVKYITLFLLNNYSFFYNFLNNNVVFVLTLVLYYLLVGCNLFIVFLLFI